MMLMKKIYLLMVGVLFLFSCEQSELDFVGDNSTEVASANTRSASSIADFDPISELGEVPLNILNVGNTKNRYLSCVQKGLKVNLFNKDDGSLRQRWYIGSGIKVVGGISIPSNLTGAYISAPASDRFYPVLVFSGLKGDPVLPPPTEPAPGIISYFAFSQKGLYYTIKPIRFIYLGQILFTIKIICRFRFNL